MEDTYTENLKLLSIDQTCRQLGLGRWNIYKLINENRLLTVKVGKRRLVTPKAIRAFIASLEAEGGVNG